MNTLSETAPISSEDKARIEITTADDQNCDHRETERPQQREVEIKVDGRSLKVPAGTYKVSVFKSLVGVAADRELDIIENDTFRPLDDNAEISVHEHEKFISHVKTGGSS